MKTFKLRTWCVAFSVVGLTVATATADDAGVARISDGGKVGVASLRGPRPATRQAAYNRSVNDRSQQLQKVSFGCTDGCTDGACAPGGGGMFGGAGAGLGAGGMFRMPNGSMGMAGGRPMGMAGGRSMGMRGACPPGYRGYGAGYNSRMNRLLGRRSAANRFWTNQKQSYFMRNKRASNALFGWMIPSGNGGAGAPPFGCYNMVYSQNPDHFDQRDGTMYAAQGYGTHVTVPLAPNVRQAYNYSWGLPSSRITKLSSVAPYTSPRPLHW